MQKNDIAATGRLVPTIRFKGFTDDWEQCKFGEMAEYKKGPFGSALKKELFVPDGNGAVKVYEQQNAINKDWHLERYYISKDYANQLNAFETHAGDIIISCAGTIGETYELPLNARPGIINQALMRVRVNEKMVRKNVFKLLFSNMIDNFSKEFSNGSAMKNIPPFADLKPIEAFVPALREQRLIDDFFTSFTALITLHQRKIDYEKRVKEYLLQNMFPREGENVPRIRFPGFTDPWEQRKLGDISQRVIVGLATSVTPYYRNKGVPIFRNLNIKENSLDDSDLLYLDRTYAESQTCKMIHTGDVLTVHTGYIGISCVVPPQYNNCLTFTTLITTTDNQKIYGRFLSQFLNSDAGMSAIKKVTTQGGRQNLNTNDFVKVLVSFPSLEEQSSIYSLLENLDFLITLHQRKLESLKELKKGLLQKMFV